MHLERLILILETVAQAGRALNVAEICEATDLPKPTTYRLVQDLIGTGLLEPETKGQFTLGARLRRIGREDPGEGEIIDIASPLLCKAADDHQTTFFLARLRGRGVEIVHVETPRDDRVSYLHPGLGFRPLHACSCAKAVAAFSSEPILATALEGKLRAYTQHTHTELADLEEEFARIRRQGFAECVQELEVGMCSVAVPVQIGEASPWLSLGATGSARLFTEAYRMRLGATLANISKTFAEILEHKASTVARNEPKAISYG